MALLLVGFTLAARPAPASAAEGEMRWGLHVTLAARWLDPAETEAFSTPFMVLYAVHDALVKPMPGGLNTPSLAESWQESKDHLTLHVHAAQERALPQRRAGDRGGREVLLRALQGRERHAPQGEGEGRAGARADPGPLRAQGALGRLHDVLRDHRLGGGVDRAEEVRAAGRRGRLQDRPGRRGALQGGLVQAGHRDRHGGLRRLLAQGALGEAPDHALDAGGDHARGRAARAARWTSPISSPARPRTPSARRPASP